MRLRDSLLQHADELAALITAELGKTLADARGELTRGIEFALKNGPLRSIQERSFAAASEKNHHVFTVHRQQSQPLLRCTIDAARSATDKYKVNNYSGAK